MHMVVINELLHASHNASYSANNKIFCNDCSYARFIFKSLAIDLSLSFIQFKAFYECQSIFYVLCLNLFIVSGIKLSHNIRYM